MMTTIDMAKVFASRGQNVTLITTISNAPLFTKSIHKSIQKGHQITLHIIKFPSSEIGLPEGSEILNNIFPPESKRIFLKAIPLFQKPIDEFLQIHHPDVLVADTYFSWANEVAAKHGIPRLIFHGTCNFSICASLCITSYKPHMRVSSDSEPFVIPNLPGEIEITRNHLPSFMKLEEENETEMSKVFKACAESDSKCYGVIVNSFHELEPAYTDFYRNVLGRKTWNIGPISLLNNDPEEKSNRGINQNSNFDHECLKWLNHKEPNSVVYICFGSHTRFKNDQLIEIALGLEASGVEFIWVLKDEENRGWDWDVEGFEERTKEKGLIIRQWAPQISILGHKSVGGFVTHCGWNSVMEAVSEGVAMATWPVSAEQFLNEKMVIEVLRIGVSVGARRIGEIVKKEAIERAVRKVMVGEEAEEMRNRARDVSVKALRAVEEGGSSHRDFNSLIHELFTKSNS